jgi:23S rRNA (uracil1939-C5)-methyltransferase
VSFPIQVEKLVYGGRGLGRSDGRVVLAPFVLPGETALVEPEKESPGLVAARTVSIQAPAGYRVAAPCPVFGRCGGCHYQHMPYEKQLKAKRDILLETLARLGRIEWTGPVEILAGEPWGYRNRTQVHFAKRGSRFEIGYFEHGSRRLCPITDCPVSSPALNRALAAVARLGPDRRFPDFLRSVELFTNEQDLLLTALECDRPLGRRFFEWCAAEIEGLCTEPRLDYAAGRDTFRVSSRSFFQINRFLVPRLAEAGLVDAAGSTALDLYAGVGLFTLPLARRFRRVVALEAGRSAVEDLAFNARRNRLEVNIHYGPVEAFLAGFASPVDFVLTDPPRAGLGPAVTAHLVRLRPQRLTLVSCEPSTLARDLRPLTRAGYRLSSVKLVDLFPQSFHIESIIELQSG